MGGGRASTFGACWNRCAHSYHKPIQHCSFDHILPSSFADIVFSIMTEYTLEEIRRLYMIMSLFPCRTWEWKKVCYYTSAEYYRSSHRSVPALKSWWNLNHDTWTKPHIMENPPSSISRSSIPNVCIPLPCHSKYADFWSELARSPATAGSK